MSATLVSALLHMKRLDLIWFFVVLCWVAMLWIPIDSYFEQQRDFERFHKECDEIDLALKEASKSLDEEEAIVDSIEHRIAALEKL